MSATPPPVREAIARALAGSPAAAGVDLEDVTVTRAGRRELVRVVVDRDGGIDLDAVAELSRVIAEGLDDPAAAAAFAGPYVLEVSSPGVDRPLREPRHWRRATDRLVDVALDDGSRVTGRVVGASETEATLATDAGEVVVPYAAVASAVVQVEFNRADDGGVADAADGAGATDGSGGGA